MVSTVTSYEVTLGERVVHVDVRRAGDQVLARVDGGEEQAVSLTPVHGGIRMLALGAGRVEVMVAVTDGEVRLAFGGREVQANVVDAAHARLAQVAGGRAGAHARRELKAPMPGLVVKVLVQAGDAVEAGQPLVVLQAMKMENELSVPRSGAVTRVSIEAGQTVEQGQTLVVVE